MYVCVCMYVYVRMYVYVCICMRVCMYVYNLCLFPNTCLGGKCPGEMSYSKREGELSGGNRPTLAAFIVSAAAAAARSPPLFMHKNLDSQVTVTHSHYNYNVTIFMHFNAKCSFSLLNAHHS